jgi:intracellular septation protein
MPGECSDERVDNLACRRREQPGKNAEQRRFTRAVCPFDLNRAAALDGECDAAKHPPPAAVGSEVSHNQSIGYSGHLPPLPSTAPARYTVAMRTPSATVKTVLDFAPLAVFFVANRVADIYVATAAVMATTLIAMAIAHFVYGRIQPMLWLVGAMVFVFGTATLLFHDAEFIKIKLTVIYALLAAVLLFGVVTKRPLLQLVLGETFPALTAAGWRTLTRNWIIFFIALAVLNEVLRRILSTTDWVSFKVFGVTILTFVFALAQTPILLRHGAKDGTEGE